MILNIIITALWVLIWTWALVGLLTSLTQFIQVAKAGLEEKDTGDWFIGATVCALPWAWIVVIWR